MVAYEVELGPQSLAAIQNLTEALNRIQPGMAGAHVRIPTPEEAGTEFLSSRQFCQKYNIGATTLKRRVEQNLVEKNNCGGKTPRYRWVEGYGDRT